MRRRYLVWAVALVLLTAVCGVTVWVESPAAFSIWTLTGAGQGRALVLYHPSRDTGFTDELARSLARGFQRAGWDVDLATTTPSTPAQPARYDLVGVVSATYYWAPDAPTQLYLRRAQLGGAPVVAVMAGAGSTGRSQRMLEERVRRAGGRVVASRSFWLWRPNDEARLEEPNRAVALAMAEELGRSSALGVQARLGGAVADTLP